MDNVATRLIDGWLARNRRRGASSRPGTLHGGAMQVEPILLGPRVLELGGGIRKPEISGGSRQYFTDTLAEPPIANQTAVTATTETILWNVTNYTPIAAGDCRPGKIYNVCAGGIYSTSTSGTLIVTPRFGLTVAAGITMGANAANNVPVSLTNVPWFLEFVVICRTVGAPGVNSTVIGTGSFTGANTGTVGTALSFAVGGTSATVDVSIATGICIGWTLSVAGSCTPEYAFIQSMN